MNIYSGQWHYFMKIEVSIGRIGQDSCIEMPRRIIFWDGSLGVTRRKKSQLQPDELGPQWAPYQHKMVTQKGQVITVPKLIEFWAMRSKENQGKSCATIMRWARQSTSTSARVDKRDNTNLTLAPAQRQRDGWLLWTITKKTQHLSSFRIITGKTTPLNAPFLQRLFFYLGLLLRNTKTPIILVLHYGGRGGFD